MERDQVIKLLNTHLLPTEHVCDEVLSTAAQLVLELVKVDNQTALSRGYEIEFSLLERDALSHSLKLVS